MESRIMEVGPGNLHLRATEGPGRGVTLLLLHAAGESSATWDALAVEWARTRPVVALDFRGHGASDHAESYSLEQMRDDVTAVLDALDLPAVDIIGHSLGGIVGYLLASARRPELRRLVLEEAPPPLPIVPPRAIPPDPGEDVGFDWQVITDLYPQRNDPDPRWWDELARIEVPTLVLAGGRESHVDQDELARMAERIPDGSLVTIPAGHNIHAERPHEFRVAVDHFLDG